MKIVKNCCYGGFGLSNELKREYLKRSGISYTEEDGFMKSINFIDEDGVNIPFDEIPRDDTLLIQLVEEMGEKADGDFADLVVVQVPDDVKWEIEDYDGMETVREVSRCW